MGAPLRMPLCQRLWCTLVSTCGTVTCDWVLLTQSWWPMSAWAGPARPSTAAVSPLAMMVANPNFFIALSFFCLFEPWRESRGSDALCAGGDVSVTDLLV